MFNVIAALVLVASVGNTYPVCFLVAGSYQKCHFSATTKLLDLMRLVCDFF